MQVMLMYLFASVLYSLMLCSPKGSDLFPELVVFVHMQPFLLWLSGYTGPSAMVQDKKSTKKYKSTKSTKAYYTSMRRMIIIALIAAKRTANSFYTAARLI